MSGAPQVRRADKLMTDERARETLERGFCGRLATIGEDGWPYCVPLLYVCMDGQIFVHNGLRTSQACRQRLYTSSPPLSPALATACAGVAHTLVHNACGKPLPLEITVRC